VSLLTGADRGLLRDVQKLLPETIEEVTIEGFSSARPGATRASGPRPPARPGQRRSVTQRPRRFNGRGSSRSFSSGVR
jgi:hypothetical protein